MVQEDQIRLQESLSGIDYIIIDEYSMLGQTVFGWVDRRCKQASGCHDKLLGNKSVILCGDPAQLPPVADKPLYHAIPANSIGEQGYLTYQMFDKVVKLNINQRVQGDNPEQIEFRELLLRLRKGDSTVSDWKLLLTRQPTNVDNLTEFKGAVRFSIAMNKLPTMTMTNFSSCKNQLSKSVQGIHLLLPKRSLLTNFQVFSHLCF